MTLRFVFTRSQFDGYSQAKTERMETIDIECSEVQLMLQRGGHGEQGHDVTQLVGIEVLTGKVPKLYEFKEVQAEVLQELLEWEAVFIQQARGGDSSGKSDSKADAAREIHDHLRSSWETHSKAGAKA